MAEAGQEPAVPVDGARKRRIRLTAVVTGVAVLLAGAAVVGYYSLRSRYDIPARDLFDDAGSTPSSGAPTGAASPSPSPQPGADLTGPMNILLVGVDTRESIPDWQPHADAVLILHLSAGLDRATLFSLPRDLYLDIPAFPKAHFAGEKTKLTHAMSYGSQVPGTSKPDVAQGFQLVAKAVTRYTGIERFDAGAVLTFRGLKRLVDAVGGVDLYVDQRVASLHRRPDGSMRTPNPSGTGYIGPQQVYTKGTHHLSGWQALDYARQRYLAGGDYTRQRHQQQLIKALVRTVLGKGLATDPVGLDRVLRALGSTLVFDGRGRTVVEFGYALRGLKPESIVLVGLPGDAVGGAGNYLGEQLDPVAKSFFRAVRADSVDAFLTAHPALRQAHQG